MASFIKLGFLLIAVAVFAGLDSTAAKIYTVGDSSGWTIVNIPNYTAWAAAKTFHVGDTISFIYNNQFHNVLEVSKADYNACKNASPLAAYSTGNDSITVKTAGHHYYICGIPGHCQIGQRVDIFATGGEAPAPSSSAAPSPSVSPTSTPTTASSTNSAPAPSALNLAPAPSAGGQSSASAQLSSALSMIIEVAVMTSAVVLMGF